MDMWGHVSLTMKCSTGVFPFPSSFPSTWNLDKSLYHYDIYIYVLRRSNVVHVYLHQDVYILCTYITILLIFLLLLSISNLCGLSKLVLVHLRFCPRSKGHTLSDSRKLTPKSIVKWGWSLLGVGFSQQNMFFLIILDFRGTSGLVRHIQICGITNPRQAGRWSTHIST